MRKYLLFLFILMISLFSINAESIDKNYQATNITNNDVFEVSINSDLYIIKIEYIDNVITYYLASPDGKKYEKIQYIDIGEMTEDPALIMADEMKLNFFRAGRDIVLNLDSNSPFNIERKKDRVDIVNFNEYISDYFCSYGFYCESAKGIYFQNVNVEQNNNIDMVEKLEASNKEESYLDNFTNAINNNSKIFYIIIIFIVFFILFKIFF
ncbi:hypothetical protein HOC99_01935 [Candidatus Woesearchaeota archaeon]|jgi:hypothetical protein|nr:hypothetical protein [Candidatus Woesearchaeota archaeon]MBT4387850.1 hypothetical protein [Candidatus Woesearchaeota archaeon]MBT4595669.1 hypothetical protein [Candidatus Woesearchaeota archaeon]MBT5740848.1 hypothetical protein [Candidatus Woesearchaeota archaeon]MBT7296037.1 hypothetical protein [Candidatus Woesearchaeota archaeon]